MFGVNLFSCRHLENISFLSFNKFGISAFIIRGFSSMQSFHRLVPLVYVVAELKMDHLILIYCLLSFEYFKSWKDF